MFKKLDILILKAFVGPFIATFFITLFVFMMQILWKYIDDLVGKGLDIPTLGEFLLYASATLVNLALPISILLSSIMTFGKLGENFELVAIKSSGISLLRFMRSLLFVSIFLSGVAFLFANNITPVANLKFARIYHDIYEKSPAFDLRPGVFYNGFQGFSIKVAQKIQDSVLNDVIIYEQTTQPQDNTILSTGGKMVISQDKQFIEFHLDNGHRYSEEYDYNPDKVEFVNLGFQSYTKLFDMSQLNMRQTADSLFKNDIRMKSLRLLNEDLDSLHKEPKIISDQLSKSLFSYVPAVRYRDTPFKKIATDKNLEKSLTDTLLKLGNKPSEKEEFSNEKSEEEQEDSLKDSTVKVLSTTSHPDHPESIYLDNEMAQTAFEKQIPDSIRRFISEMALSKVRAAQNATSLSADKQANLETNINRSEMEWHKKLAVSFACIVLFFIGAPLGSIIRKGGLGMPLVVALIFFMVYYLLSIFGEKFAKDQVVTPLAGMWLPVIVLTPIGFFLTYKAMHDSQLFNKEFYYRLGRAAKRILVRGKKAPVPAVPNIADD